MILLIDNYDSFTYNLVQRLGELDPGMDLQVFRNDKITADQVEAMKPSHMIISPGPCTPREAGVSNEVIERLAPARADPGGVPGTPVHRPCLRRRGGPQLPDHARQDVA